MSLGAVIDAVEARERTLTVYNADQSGDLVEELSAYLADLNVDVRAEKTPSGRPADLGVLSIDGDVLATVPGGRLRSLLAEVPTGPGNVGIDDTDYRQLLQHLKETTFTSYDRERMLQASREIEERAHRLGTGTVAAGFQLASLLEDQASTYRTLADRGLDTAVYATPDEEPPAMPGVAVHVTDDEELRRHWFVSFDGGGERDQACALLAEEREPGTYYGFWTYDAGVVERIERVVLERFGRTST